MHKLSIAFFYVFLTQISSAQYFSDTSKTLNLRPDISSLSGTANWSYKQGIETYDIQLNTWLRWTSSHNEIDIRFRNNFLKIEGYELANNFLIRTYWYYDTEWNLFSVLNRDYEQRGIQVDNQTIDFQLSNAGLGLGVFYKWSEYYVRLGGVWNEYIQSRKGSDINLSYTTQTIFLHSQFAITQSLVVSQYFKYIFWQNNKTGYDSEVELNQFFSPKFSLGLRYIKQKDASSIISQTQTELRFLAQYFF